MRRSPRCRYTLPFKPGRGLTLSLTACGCGASGFAKLLCYTPFRLHTHWHASDDSCKAFDGFPPGRPIINARYTGQTLPGTDPSQSIKWHAELARRFKAGDTNVSPLVVTWFDGATFFVRVEEKTGKIISGFSGFSQRGSPRGTLDGTNQQLLVKTLADLPLPPKEILPDRRQILISGIRSNQWFHAVYDRAKLPEQVARLCNILDPHLNPAIPLVSP